MDSSSEFHASSEFQDSLPTSSDALMSQLTLWDLPFSYHEHAPLRTVDQSKQVRAGFLSEEEGGGHIKNLFLRDKKKQNYLVVRQEDAAIDLNSLLIFWGQGGFHLVLQIGFWNIFGVRPGAVTPLSMINGCHHGVTLYLDKSIMQCQMIYMHPLVNDRTIGMTPDAVKRFLKNVGCYANILDIDRLTGD